MSHSWKLIQNEKISGYTKNAKNSTNPGDRKRYAVHSLRASCSLRRRYPRRFVSGRTARASATATPSPSPNVARSGGRAPDAAPARDGTGVPHLPAEDVRRVRGGLVE